jgi:carbon-monoxide dehydrogenase large subunit
VSRNVVGSSAPRARDRDLVAGRGRFVADVDRPGQVYARVVRSPVAHAVIRAVHAHEARAAPGVVAVVLAHDVPNTRIPIRLPFAATPNAALALQPLLAADRVRYVGEPVAVVVADDPWRAEDAAEMIR